MQDGTELGYTTGHAADTSAIFQPDLRGWGSPIKGRVKKKNTPP